MAIGLPVDPRSLIESYDVLREASRLWLQDLRPVGDDERFAELTVVASDRVLFEPYACAFGLSSETGEEPIGILSEVPYEALVNGDVDPAEVAFLEYSRPHTTISLPEFVGGSYVLARHYRDSPFANSAGDIVCIADCAREHRNDPEAIKRCIRENCY